MQILKRIWADQERVHLFSIDELKTIVPDWENDSFAQGLMQPVADNQFEARPEALVRLDQFFELESRKGKQPSPKTRQFIELRRLIASRSKVQLVSKPSALYALQEEQYQLRTQFYKTGHLSAEQVRPLIQKWKQAQQQFQPAGVYIPVVQLYLYSQQYDLIESELNQWLNTRTAPEESDLAPLSYLKPQFQVTPQNTNAYLEIAVLLLNAEQTHIFEKFIALLNKNILLLNGDPGLLLNKLTLLIERAQQIHQQQTLPAASALTAP